MAAGKNKETENILKPFYVYEILDEHGNVIYIGKGCKYRVNSSLRIRGGKSYKIVKRFEHESAAYSFEKLHISKHKNLLNQDKGGSGGYVTKGTKEERLIAEIGLKAYTARILLNYYNAFKCLASKVDKYYTKETQQAFSNLDISRLMEVAYGSGQKNGG